MYIGYRLDASLCSLRRIYNTMPPYLSRLEKIEREVMRRTYLENSASDSIPDIFRQIGPMPCLCSNAYNGDADEYQWYTPRRELRLANANAMLIGL